MKAELKGVHSPDVDDVRKYSPPDPVNFAVLIQALIGPMGEPGAESFNIEVCTPRWLETQLDGEGAIFGRHLLVVRNYDYEAIVKKIERFLDLCTGSDWPEIARKVSRIGLWEFEDYEG